ncbi:MAG TPA: hypothetical protein VFU88_22175 [Ktedonobacterales bacterium]|nr:hypothetical protein [Ktedonobacterales bacterium]
MSVRCTLVAGAVMLLAFCLPLTAAGSTSYASALASAHRMLATTTASGTASPTGSPGADITTATAEPTSTATLTSAEVTATAAAHATATADAATATATAAAPNPDSLPCLSVGGSTCPLASTVTVTVNAPSTLTVTGSHWPYSPAQPASNVVDVYLVADLQPCGPVPGDAVQAQIDSLGTFTAALPLPAAARDGVLYGVCARSADGKAAFPAGSSSTTSLLHIRIARSVEVAPLDLFSVLAIGLAALAALLYLFRPRRASTAA